MQTATFATMSHSLTINSSLSKIEKYQLVISQIQSLLSGEKNHTANAANVAAVLKEVFNFFWVGFYLCDKENNNLVLGPFQGPVACTRINYSKGVCGVAWREQKTQIVPDVSLFPGHIACSANTKSEIVVPVFNDNNQLLFVLDVDSDKSNDFDTTDAELLEQLVELIKLQVT